MKRISSKDHDHIQAVVFRASDEFLTFLYSRGGILDLYDDLQACRKRLDLERLLNFSRSDFSHDLIIISRYCRLNKGNFTPYCLKQKNSPCRPPVTGRV